MYTRVHAQLGSNDFKGLRHLRELTGPQFHRDIVLLSFVAPKHPE